MKPKVSILIPAYKRSELFKKALDSLLLQSFTDYEVIICDDTPDDSIKLIVDKIKNKKIKYYKNPLQYGSAKNWNTCVERANGEYIKFLHNDDYFVDNSCLAKMVQALDDNQNVNLAFSSCYNVRTDGSVVNQHLPEKYKFVELAKSPYFLFPENIIGAPSTTIYRKYANVLFDEKLKWVVDIDFYIRILEKNCNYHYIAEPLVSVLAIDNNRVTNKCNESKDIEIFEWLYLYNKLIKKTKLKNNQIKFLKRLFKKYNITSIEELENISKQKVNLPITIHLSLFFNKIGALKNK